MSMYIDELTSDVSVYNGESPDPQQLEQLVRRLVREQLEQLERERQDGYAATNIRNRNAPPMWNGEMDG